MRHDRRVVQFEMAWDGEPTGGWTSGPAGAGLPAASLGVLEWIDEARQVLEPWQNGALAPVTGTERGWRQGEVCERMRASLRDARGLLARGRAAGAEVRADRRAEVAALQRAIGGRLHEALWLARQASRRAAGLSAMLDATTAQGCELATAVESLRAISERTAALVAGRARAA